MCTRPRKLRIGNEYCVEYAWFLYARRLSQRNSGTYNARIVALVRYYLRAQGEHDGGGDDARSVEKWVNAQAFVRGLEFDL